jgi:hypothetical protein
MNKKKIDEFGGRKVLHLSYVLGGRWKEKWRVSTGATYALKC